MIEQLEYRARAVFALAIATLALMLVTSTGLPAKAAEPSAATLAECQAALLYPDRSESDVAFLTACVHALTPRGTTTPSSTTSSPAPTQTTSPPSPSTTNPSTTPPATTPPATTTPPGPSVCPAFPRFPDAGCTGWRHTGVTLKPCGPSDGHLETPNVVYDSCVFNNGVVIQAPGITIQRSWIKGNVRAHWSFDYDYLGAKLIDVEIGPSSNPELAAVSNGPNFTGIRLDAHHTATGVHLGDNSSLIDSWVHDRIHTDSHGSAVGLGQNSGNNTKIIHNNLDCAPTNGAVACSGAAVLYDEPTLNNVLVQYNLFNSKSGYCLRNGPGATNIRVLDNIFGRKYYTICGLFGPVSQFYPNNTGNQWLRNTYPDGTPVTV